jgi:hypothetical protein
MSSASDVNVSAFIMMHGVVKPRPIPKSQQMLGDPPSHEYILSASRLPRSTQLFAPSILGNSYYDHPESEDFIYQLHVDYQALPLPKPSYIDYCLKEIRHFEQRHVDSLEKTLESNFRKSQQTEHERKLQHSRSEAITHKSLVKWEEHEFYIEQKTYFIDPRDVPNNSIMFYCQEQPQVNLLLSIFKEPAQFITKHKSVIRYKVEYKRPIFIIHFLNEDGVDDILVDDILVDDIINILLSVLQQIISQQHRFTLSIFDFTCSELIFPSDDRVSGVKPVLLSSESGLRPRLVYGTIRDDRSSQMDRDEGGGRLAAANYGSPSPRPSLSLSSQSSSQSSSHRYSFSGHSVSPSPAHPTASLIVNLLEGVETFVNFKLKFDSRGRSVSPRPVPEEVDGGGRRRVVKKVFRSRMTRRCRRRNSRTTVQSKRKRTKSKR